MVNTILKYIGSSVKASLTFLDNCYAPAFRIDYTGEVYYGDGVAKENVSICDIVGNGAYIRLLQPETARETKRISSCSKKFNYSAKCRLVYYSFTDDAKEWPIDKRKQAIKNVLNNLTFLGFKEMSSEISISINTVDDNFQKVFKAETNQEFSGDKWPFIIAIDFTINYSTSTDSECQDLCVNTDFEIIEPTPENSKTFCEKLESCNVINELQSKVIDLQEQIDNLPQSGLTCTDLPNCQTIIDILQSINDIVSGLPSSYFSCGDLAVCQTIIDIVSDISDLQTQVGTNTTDISTLQGQVSSLISDLGTLTTTVNNHISDTSNPHNVTLEQARSENSSISGDINANNNTIINLKDAVNPQEPITKIQFDTYVSAVGGNRGAIDCSANPNYPASNKGDRWEVTVAGKIGGPSGINVDVYDEIVCVTASASGDQATVGVNFYIVQGNIERATETTNGYTSYATDVEVQAGIENTKSITPLKLYNWFVALVQSVFVKKGTLTTNYIPKATASDTIGDSNIIDDGTNVGIGLISPTSKVHIHGADSTSANYSLKVDNSASSPLLYVRNDGNVGISTASPIAKLDVNGSIRSENLTASQIVATDASKNLQSLDVATYPSLTELAYIKGLTSAIQAQIDAKLSTPTPTDYSATSTINGFSSFTTKIIQVINMGAYDLINYDIGGTSNATTLSFTVPNALSASAPAVSSIMHSLSGATNGSGLAQLAVGATQVNCFLNVSSGTWTASGTKRVRGTIIVQK